MRLKDASGQEVGQLYPTCNVKMKICLLWTSAKKLSQRCMLRRNFQNRISPDKKPFKSSILFPNTLANFFPNKPLLFQKKILLVTIHLYLNCRGNFSSWWITLNFTNIFARRSIVISFCLFIRVTFPATVHRVRVSTRGTRVCNPRGCDQTSWHSS